VTVLQVLIALVLAAWDLQEKVEVGTVSYQAYSATRLARFVGGAPPPGDARHRYVIVVQAIGIEKVGQLQVQADSTPA